MSADLDRRQFIAGATAVAGSMLAVEAARPRLAFAAPAPEFHDLTELTLAQTATAIRRGRVSSEEVVQAHLERIAAFESTYLAFNTILAEQALARARMLDRRRRPVGALHGVPIVVKDNYWTRGVETRPIRTSSKGSCRTKTRPASRACCGRVR